MAEDWRRLDERVDHLSGEITALARQDAGCQRLMSVPGVGPIISSAVSITQDGSRLNHGPVSPTGHRPSARHGLLVQ
jgi:transposase